jgi:glutamate 5-kinase
VQKLLISRGKSLLAAGMAEISGNFIREDTTIIFDAKTKKDFARALVNCSGETVEKIKGRKTSEMKKIICVTGDEIVRLR